jgi:hypothetical protein
LCICVHSLFTLFPVSSLMWSVTLPSPRSPKCSLIRHLRSWSSQKNLIVPHVYHLSILLFRPFTRFFVGSLPSELAYCSAFDAISSYSFVSTA